jgi:hypothetical protein
MSDRLMLPLEDFQADVRPVLLEQVEKGVFAYCDRPLAEIRGHCPISSLVVDIGDGGLDLGANDLGKVKGCGSHVSLRHPNATYSIEGAFENAARSETKIARVLSQQRGEYSFGHDILC